VAAATGRRREDVLALTAADLRPVEGAIIFDKRAVLGGKGAGVVIEALDKNFRTARVDVDETTMAGLEALVEKRKREAAAAGVVFGKRAHLFSDDLGANPWRPDSTSRAFRQLRDRVGLTDITLHGLRHAHITELLEGGLDVEAVAKRVGDDPMTIYNVYAHSRRTSDRRAAAIMAGVLDGAERRLVALEGNG
jgi:integrase